MVPVHQAKVITGLEQQPNFIEWAKVAPNLEEQLITIKEAKFIIGLDEQLTIVVVEWVTTNLQGRPLVTEAAHTRLTMNLEFNSSNPDKLSTLLSSTHQTFSESSHISVLK